MFGVSVEYGVYVSVLLTKQEKKKAVRNGTNFSAQAESCVRRIANLGSFVIYEINLQWPPRHALNKLVLQ